LSQVQTKEKAAKPLPKKIPLTGLLAVFYKIQIKRK
jgi:hypothetical protein